MNAISPEQLKQRLDAVDAAPVNAAPSASPYVSLLPVDPYRLHAFWSISPETYRAALDHIGRTGAPALCIRMLQLPDRQALDEEAVYWFDVEVHGFSRSWTIDVAEGGRCYRAVLGVRGRADQWVPVARSAAVHTPAGQPPIDAPPPDVDVPPPPENPPPLFAEPEPVLDEEGILAQVDEEMRAAPAAAGAPGASLSSAWSAVTEHAAETSAEWVIEGRAAPGIQVWVQNRPVPLDEEGSFTIRRPLTLRELDRIEIAEGSEANGSWSAPERWSATRWNEPLFEMASTLHLRGRIEGAPPPALAALGATIKEDGTFGLVRAVPQGAFMPPAFRITGPSNRDAE